jgi:hypothetical protein
MNLVHILVQSLNACLLIHSKIYRRKVQPYRPEKPLVFPETKGWTEINIGFNLSSSKFTSNDKFMILPKEVRTLIFSVI